MTSGFRARRHAAPTIEPVRPRPRRVAVAGVASLGLVLAGCSNKGPESTFRPEGKYAQKIDNLARPWFYIAGVVGLAVFGVVVYIIVKYRARASDTQVPRQLHGNTPLEIMWTAAPAVLLTVMAYFTVTTVIDVNKTAKDPMVIEVYGQQWWWEYNYTGAYAGIVTATDLVIPAKTEVQLKISSRDVVHSYWLPRLNGKRDAVPGRTQPMNIEADEPGVYMGQCTEFCGLSHANMRERVIVLSEADFATWAANQLKPAAAPTDAAAVRGAQSFAQRCSSCHQVNGSYVDAAGKTAQFAPVDASVSLVSGVAPNLTHLMSRGVFAGGTFELHVDGDPAKPLNRPDLEAWLRNPSSLKPMAPDERRGMPNLGLTESQIDDLIAYLSTLK